MASYLQQCWCHHGVAPSAQGYGDTEAAHELERRAGTAMCCAEHSFLDGGRMAVARII
jgi:hypothetical protein